MGEIRNRKKIMKYKFFLLVFILLGLSSCTVTKEYNVKLYNGKPSVFANDGLVSLLNGDGSPNTINRKKAALDGVLSKVENNRFWELISANSITEFVVMRYLHGVRVCGGRWTKGSYRNDDKVLNKVLPQFGSFEFRNFHYGEAEQKRYRAVANYQKDIDGEINQMFFGGFSYCSSYVTVRRDGQYIGWFGELAPIEDIPEMVKFNMEK